MSNWLRKHTWAKFAVASAAALVAVQVSALAPAFANAANPNPDTSGTAMVNADGTVTANLSGTWSWPGQTCEGRYGEGWAVDWWGISSSQTPANPFSLTNATEVTGPGTTTTGTISPAGAIPIQGGTYFHVPAFYAGEDVNSSSTCTDTANGGSTGSWSASATYPSLSDIPAQVCVNMYDEHGSEGKPSGSANDFSPVQDNDNSIQTNNFNPASGAGYCVALKVMKPKISLLKQICTVTASKCDTSLNSDWASSQEIPSGSTAVWRLTTTNTGSVPLSNVTITDALAPACAGQVSASLAPKAVVVTSCSTGNVTKGFTNVAKVTGAPPSGASVSATSSAVVTVIKPPPGITTSQSLTPNDEGFVVNGEGATGKMTFKLYPPGQGCKGTPFFQQTVTVTNGIAETTNTTLIATMPGTWKWLVTYTGDATHSPATSPCGTEKFTLTN